MLTENGPNSGEASPLKDLLKNLLHKLDSERPEAAIQRVWEEICDEDTLAHTRPVSFSNGKLVVLVSDTTRLYQLSLRTEAIRTSVNEKTGRVEVKEIRFKIGKI